MKNINDYARLIDYIKQIYIQNDWDDSDIPLPKIGTQIKKLIAENPKQYTYATIQYTLWYMIEIEQLNVLQDDSDSFVPLVPYHFINARAFNKQCRDIKKSVENFDFTDSVIIVKKGNGDRQRNNESLSFDELSFDDVKQESVYDWKADLDRYKNKDNKIQTETIEELDELSFD